MRQTGAEVRVCVCGDEGSGKSSLIMSLVKDIFVPHGLQAVLPMITIPPSIGTPENVTTTIVDTSGMSDIYHAASLTSRDSKYEVGLTFGLWFMLFGVGVALPQDRNTLRKEIRRSNVICLVYSDHYVGTVRSVMGFSFQENWRKHLLNVVCD